MKKSILLLFTLFFTLLGQAQVTKTVYSTAGTLYSKMTATELSTVTNLIILGTIDARDFVTLRDNMTKLAVLDISNVSISTYTGSLGSGGLSIIIYPANSIPNYAFCGNVSPYSGKKTLISVIFPSTLTSIAQNAFANCTGLTGTLTLPSSVTNLGDYAFFSCSGLTGSLILLNSIDSIGYQTFCACTGLTGVLTIPSSTTYIGENAFNDLPNINAFNVDVNNLNYSSINGVLFNKNQTLLILYPFTLQGKYSIPKSVSSIDNAFVGCNGLTEITIPNSVTSIGEGAFANCTGLTNLFIPNSVTSIVDYAFDGCTGLTTIEIPNSVTSIGNFTFYGCFGLTNLVIRNSVTSIGTDVFSYCTGLVNLTIPISVTSIGTNAFSGCTRLTSIYANSILPIDLSSSPNVFASVNKLTCTLYVPIGSKKYYSTINQWEDFTNIVETTTAIQNVNSSNINLYPNPTTDYFKISGFYGTALITLKDLNGKTLLTKQITDNENISVSSLCKGVYILEITTNEGTIEKKIIKD